MTAKKGLNKTEIKKLLVAERQKMREKAKASEFMRKTLSIYNAQKGRAEDLGKQVPYSLSEFRDLCHKALEREICPYCDGKLTIKNMTCDHRDPVSMGGDFTLENSSVVCKPCNWQKGGVMTANEFRSFKLFLRQNYHPKVTQDILMRLSTGGKFHPGK